MIIIDDERLLGFEQRLSQIRRIRQSLRSEDVLEIYGAPSSLPDITPESLEDRVRLMAETASIGHTN